MTPIRGTLLLNSVLVGALVLAGCGRERVDETPEVAEEASAGGVAVVCSDGSADNLNPFVSPNLAARDMGQLLFTPLVRYGSGTEFAPYLAREWSWGPERQTLTLQLRENVRWHDGTPLTAADVAWTLQVAADPEYAYSQGRIFAGLEAEAVDSLTVEVRFLETFAHGLEPFVSLPILPRHLLADVPPSEFARAAYHRAPVGSGPFRFAGRREDGSIMFDRWSEIPEDLGPPLLDRIVYRTIAEPTVVVTELTSGAVDLCTTNAGLAARLQDSQRIRLETVAPFGVQTVFLNAEHRPLDDVRVRRALSAALRRSEIAAVVSPLASVAGNPLPPVSPFQDSTLVQPNADSALAVSLLEEAGWRYLDGTDVRRNPEGQELRFSLVGDPQAEPEMTVIQHELSRLGVVADVRFMEAASFFAAVMNPRTRPDAMALALYHDRVIRPDMHGLLHSGGPQNISSYSDSVVDSVLTLLQSTTEPQRLRDLYEELQRQLVEDVPALYTVYVPRLLAVGARLRGVRADLNGPLASVSEWWIPETQRRRR